MRRSKGFTLIELLVVIAIIALLLSIIMPALSKAKSLANRLMCSNRIHQQYLGISLYSNDNIGYVPTTGAGWWLWDMSFFATNEISRYAGFDESEVFFCPANKMKKHDDARFWQFTWTNPSPVPVPIKDESVLTDTEQRGHYRVLPMIYIFDRYDSNGNSILPPTLVNGKKAQWIRKLSKVKNSSSQEMIMDTVISQLNDYNFFAVTAGGIGNISNGKLKDNSNHESKKTVHSESGSGSGPKPEGANIGFADGHAEWRKFDGMEHQVTVGMWFWW
jgi:prepilin-type N-terminal cleavage/methylation domain-containing protein/prepilin-type processing-associated H-X9-DG protein